MSIIKLKNRSIGESSMPYVIAEIGVNHEGSISKAKELIDMISLAGGHAAKFQTYKADKLAAKNSPAYWDTSEEPTTSQYKLFKKYDSFNIEDYYELAEYCSLKGVDFISTPFDSDAVEQLAPIMDVYKIASADITNVPLLRKIAEFKKPVIMSTGASKFWEIDNAINVLNVAGISEISLLHCMLNYPTAYENAGLGMIDNLKKYFPNTIIGYSDHTLPEFDMLTVMTAIAKGAKVIEKHFTHDKTLQGNDHYHAMDFNDLKNLMSTIERQSLIMGDVDEVSRNEELSARINARRSIVTSLAVAKGTLLTEQHLTYKRPESGISTIHWDTVIGRVAAVDMDVDHIMQWADII
jgi:sialic acid synthase SpsE